MREGGREGGRGGGVGSTSLNKGRVTSAISHLNPVLSNLAASMWRCLQANTIMIL